MDNNTKLIRTGIAGAIVSLLCCFTPLLAIGLSALGLTAYIVKLDYVLIPAFLASVALVIFAVVRRKRSGVGLEASKPRQSREGHALSE